MVILEEIAVANGVAVVMMLFLLICRQKNRESIHTEDKFYDGMVAVTLIGAFFETVSFFIDGRDIAGGRFINIFTNSICFAGTVTVGFLWCLYVELRIYRNYKRTMHNARALVFPWIAEIIVIILNLFDTDIMFTVSEDNVYQRCAGAVVGYITLVVYFAYSVYLVYHSKNRGTSLNFFPVLLFIGPCFAGVVIQLLCYGITTSWISVAVALTFVQMQLYAQNIYTDELSGLYNRRYLNGMLKETASSEDKKLYGIMLDVDDFKSINDSFGHTVGDRAICAIGEILFRSVPQNGTAIRYAGDEFIVLLSGTDEDGAAAAIHEIEESISAFNRSGVEPFTLSMSMGYIRFGENDDAESFMAHMDRKMYEAKRQKKNHQLAGPEESET